MIPSFQILVPAMLTPASRNPPGNKFNLQSYFGWKAANGGGQNASCDFFGGRGERSIECPLQNHFWRPQEVGFVWSVPVWGKRIIGVGVQNRFWGGV